MKKALNILLLMLLILAVLPGCAKRGTTVSPSPSAAVRTGTPLPSASPSVVPSLTPLPSASPDASASPEASSAPDNVGEGIDEMIGYDFEALQTEVTKLSEISDCTIAAIGEKALVGVTFDPAYQGTLTSRIVEMIGEQVTGKEPGITKIAVTADPGQVREIETLAAETKGDPTMKDKKEAFEALFQKLEPTGTNRTDK